MADWQDKFVFFLKSDLDFDPLKSDLDFDQAPGCTSDLVLFLCGASRQVSWFAETI